MSTQREIKSVKGFDFFREAKKQIGTETEKDCIEEYCC